MSEKFTTARITRTGEKFEILVKPEPALDYKTGKPIGLSQILAIDEIYSDAGKGTRASSEKLEKAFGTSDALKIAEEIMKHGELQLTTDQRRQLVEDKRKQIVAFISRNCIDPRSATPHPPMRIEQAMNQVKYSIDPFKNADEQAKDIIEELRTIIPIKMEQMRVGVKVLAEFSAKGYGAIKNFGTITREEWQADGALVAVVEMPAGLYGPFVERLGKITQGTIQTKVIK
jgi:ribosome maturation protein SDO1